MVVLVAERENKFSDEIIIIGLAITRRAHGKTLEAKKTRGTQTTKKKTVIRRSKTGNHQIWLELKDFQRKIERGGDITELKDWRLS